MSEFINSKRRKFIQLGIFGGLTLLIKPKKLFGDDLTDLVGINQHKNEVVAVRLWPSSVYTRLTIEAENSIKAKYNVKDNPLKLIIDLEESTLNQVINDLSKKVLKEDPIVDRINVFQLDNEIVRINISLKQHVLIQTKILPPIKSASVDYKYRYVLDMYPGINEVDSEFNDDLLALLQLKNDDLLEDSLEPKLSTIKSRRKLHRELKEIPKTEARKKLLVILDPGHGGEDPGAVGPSGIKEKDIVLMIAKQLQKIINQTEHLEAYLTREQDIFIPLATRVKIARRAKADLFISIHADAFINQNATGSSVFVLSERGASSSYAKWLAKSQNSADMIGGISFNTKDKLVNRVLFDMVQTWTMKSSNELAQVLLGKIKHVNTLHKKQVEKAGFAVLKAPDIPSVLIETAFISNPREEALLNKASFQGKVATALFQGINDFAKSLLKT